MWIQKPGTPHRVHRLPPYPLHPRPRSRYLTAGLFSILWILTPILATPAAAQVSPWPDWESFYAEVSRWSLDSSRVATVQSLMLERDAGTIVLESGRLAMARRLGGRVVAAQFVGQGTFSFVPRSEIERQQLRRFFGATSLRRRFQRMTLIATDSTIHELESSATFRPDSIDRIARAWRATLPYLTWKGTKQMRPLSVAQTMVEARDDGLFWAVLGDVQGGRSISFRLDPSLTERVVLARSPDEDNWGLMKRYDTETVCQSFAAGDPDTLRYDMRPSFDATHFDLDVELGSSLDLRATAGVSVVARGAPRIWFPFLLPRRLHIDDVSAPGRACRFFQDKEINVSWVRVDPPLAPDSTTILRFQYHGDCFDRDDENRIYLVRGWYPDPYTETDATWDLTFHYPKDLQLVASGERVSEEERRGTMTARWRLRRPTPWASFDVGFMRGLRVLGDSLPPLTVWSEHTAGAGRVTDVRVGALRNEKGEDEHTAYDVARALEFFGREWGAPSVTSFNAVTTPLSTLVALPGLIRMMPKKDRRVSGAEYTPDVYRAHEIAHQWWGLGLRPATYHDLWLSEGFADFASIWYLQAGRHDTKTYLDVLESWRKKLLENRHFLLGNGQQAGPIWLGPRTNSSSTPDDYDLVVYSKGAWVLHMLRSYLLDDADPGESRFRGLLRDFYAEWNGRRAFTEDFRAAVERATGEDMGWFFDQWVYGTDVPTYAVRWTISPADSGRWRVHGHVDQTNAPASFRAPILMRVDYDNGEFSRTRVWIRGASSDFDLPLAPRKPAKVLFNDLESALCEVIQR